MRILQTQILAGTKVDSQGEKLSKEFLQRYCDSVGKGRFPLHQQHDMSKPVAGYIENVKLVPDTEPDEWNVVGDVYIEEGSIDDVLGGFSISGIEMLRRSESATALVYIPFPQYHDTELIAALTADPDLNVGKWIKKAAEPIGWVVLGSVIAFAITPVWDDVYKRKIGPRIDRLLEKYMKVFEEKGLSSELAQIIIHKDNEVEVRLIPTRGKESECLKSTVVEKGLRKVVDFLSTDIKANGTGVTRIVIFYNDALANYEIHRVEYSNGTIEHFA